MLPAWPGAQGVTDPHGYSPQTYTTAGWSAAAAASLVPRPAPPAGTDPVAIVALVLAVLLPPVGVVLAVVALVRTRRSRRRGTLLAVLALAVGAVLSAVLALLPALAPGLVPRLEGATTPLDPGVEHATEVHVRRLTAGSCLDAIPTGATERVTVVPCAGPHGAAVVSTYAFDDAAEWPGADAVARRVAGACTLTAEEAAAGVRAVALAPTEASWAQGDRTGLCLVSSTP